MHSRPLSISTTEHSTGRPSDIPPASQRSIEELIALAIACDATMPALLFFDDESIVDCISLESDDPVAELYCRTVPDAIKTVGLCAHASVTSLNPTPQDNAPTTVFHIVQRSGTSATVLVSESEVRWFGPTMQPQQGRVPDSCRRLLQLTTTVPSATMTDFVIAAWLEVLIRHALTHPTVEWETIVELHPAGSSVPPIATPSSVAEATRSLGAALDWDRFRLVIATVGGFPFGDNACEIANWMDSGMFSRWAMESLPTRSEALGILESTLGPATFDRLWATLRLCD